MRVEARSCNQRFRKVDAYTFSATPLIIIYIFRGIPIMYCALSQLRVLIVLVRVTGK